MRHIAFQYRSIAVGFALSAAVLLVALASAECLSADTLTAPTTAIKYVEYPEGGDLRDKGRELTTTGQAYYGIDINSRLEIRVGAQQLGAALIGRAENTPAAVRAKQLAARLESLKTAAEELRFALENLKALLPAWENAQKTKNWAAFETQLRNSANQRYKINDALYKARRARLQEGGQSQEDADQLAKAAFDRVFAGGPKVEFGYDWQALERLFAEEIGLAEAEIRKVGPDLGLKVDIQAQLIRPGGSADPVFLPNYNQEKTGVETRYEKLRFAVPESEKKLYDQYEQTAKQIGEANSAGEAVVKLLRSEYDSIRAALKDTTAAAEAAFEQSKDKLRAVEQWASPEKRKTWLESVKSDLQRTPEGITTQSAWEALGKVWNDMQDDVEALRAYADMRQSLSGQTAPQAMDTILRTFDAIRVRDPHTLPHTVGLRVLDPLLWKGRVAKLDEFVDAVKALEPALQAKLTGPGSPYADLIAARDSLKAFGETLKETAQNVSRWIGEVLFMLPANRAASELRVPAGQKRLAVFGDTELSTSVNLLTVRQSREVGQTLSIQYRFFQGDSELSGSWHDEFVLQSYGWQSNVLASLAFANQSGASTWKPTAAINWILSRAHWPKAGERGLGGAGQIKWFSGAGLSAMPLYSSSAQDIQLGLAATLAFLNNRILVGYGVNLQAEEDKGFFFISIRLFTFPGLSGSLTDVTSAK